LLTKVTCFVAAAICVLPAALAQRRAVLPQIDLPHPYYYREMYLPQLTSGPSSVAWSPDSQEVVYSMAGSLWRQRIDSGSAVQLTDGPGYDYQPDWSPNAKNIIYVSYQKDAMELWLLDLATGRSHQLTSEGAVNVEPRWSPDGRRIVFVSTLYNKRFHIFRADVNNGKLENVVRLTGETKSTLPRYYYSAYDMEISPVWARDAKEILFVSNRGHIHGTGGFWRMQAEPGAEAREIHYEETNWKARPDFSPEGSRIVYSSYLGREWHQLWVMPANGGDVFPISYATANKFSGTAFPEFEEGWDDTCVRWSPDGKRLAFISNRNANTELWLRSVPQGKQFELRIDYRRFLRTHAGLTIRVTDGRQGLPARLSVTDAAGRSYAPNDVWIYADDGYDRAERPFEAQYFYPSIRGYAKLNVPVGRVVVEAVRVFENVLEKRTIEVQAGQDVNVEVKIAPSNWHEEGKTWVSADLHVHMNYGGEYRNDPGHLQDQAEGEGLAIINNLIVNKEQRFPDIVNFIPYRESVSGKNTAVVQGQEFHTNYWGHRGILMLRDHLLIPGYAGYPNTAAASLYPMNADVYDMAHAQGALVGAVHPFETAPDPFANPPQPITDELPVDVALGKIDYMEIVGFSDHRATASVWYRLLNLGFRIPAGAGTDAMANFASLRGPVGMNRVYALVPEWPLSPQVWFDALIKGRTFATNGPLLDFAMGGQEIGGELHFDKPQSVPFRARLRSIVPVDHFELVCNGQVAQKLSAPVRDEVFRTGIGQAEVSGTVPLKESGWCALRASSDKAEYPVLDDYVYATTSPIYVTIGGKKPRSPEDAKYFVAWIDRMMETTAQYPDWNSPAEKQSVMKRLAEAKGVFQALQQ
jgi:TolB protein